MLNIFPLNESLHKFVRLMTFHLFKMMWRGDGAPTFLASGIHAISRTQIPTVECGLRSA